MAKCNHCGRDDFRSQQAVKGHLLWCEEWRQKKRARGLDVATPYQPANPGRVQDERYFGRDGPMLQRVGPPDAWVIEGITQESMIPPGAGPPPGPGWLIAPGTSHWIPPVSASAPPVANPNISEEPPTTEPIPEPPEARVRATLHCGEGRWLLEDDVELSRMYSGTPGSWLAQQLYDARTPLTREMAQSAGLPLKEAAVVFEWLDGEGSVLRTKTQSITLHDRIAASPL